MTRQMSFEEAANIVKQSLDILDVIGRRMVLRKSGRSYTGLCPFHNEKSPSFYVTPDKQLFKCFGCGEGGDTLSFLMKYEHKTYGELISEMAEDAGIEIIREGRPQTTKSDLDVMLQLQVMARTFFQEQLQASESVQAYLMDRQVSQVWQTHFGLGYAPAGWENLVNYLKKHSDAVQKDPSLLEKAGLANIKNEGSGYYDRFRNRLMIPIHDDRGRMVAFGGRSLTPEDMPKYMNSPETSIYLKNKVLYGLFQAKDAIRNTKQAILMEGYFDVISAHMAGVTQAVGVCGTALTENQVKLLKRTGAETLYLCFDSDEAGQTAALRAIELVEYHLLEHSVNLKVVLLPGEKDPDDFLKTQGKERFLQCLENAQDFLSFKFSKALSKIANLHSPEGRIQAVQTLTPMLAAIHQPVVRQEHVRLIAERLKLAEETLLLEIRRVEKQNVSYPNKQNQENSAIFKMPERYKGRKRWDRPQPGYKPEDMTVFRTSLSRKIPIEDKEHLLISYLLLNEESYRLVMNTLQQLQLESPLAQSFLGAVHALEGQWQTINELVHKLGDGFHREQNTELMQFLADRALVVDELMESYENSPRGLKSFDHRQKLDRDIEDIVSTIELHRKRASLSTLAKNGKQLEQQEDDLSALQVQMQLREKIKAQRSKNSTLQDYKIPLEEEQGV